MGTFEMLMDLAKSMTTKTSKNVLNQLLRKGPMTFGILVIENGGESSILWILYSEELCL